MFKKRFSAVLLFACVISGHIWAQQYLNIEDCRRLAIDNNKALKIASEEENVAYYEKKEALMKFFPEISFMGTYLRNQKNIKLIQGSSIPSQITTPAIQLPSPPITIPSQTLDISGLREELLKATELDIKNVWAGGFTLTQPLFVGGKIVAYHDLRSYAEELSKTMREAKMTDVIVEVDNAYWQVVSISNKKKLAEAYVNLLKKMDNDVQAMLDEGVATKADRLSVSVKLNEAETTLTKAENGLSLSKMLLSQLCGLDISDAITLRDENTEALSDNGSTNELINVDEALSSRTEIKSLELATQIYKKQERIAMADFLPNVALTANYLWTNPNGFDGFQNKFGGMWNVGVVVQVPLNIGTSSAKLNAAKAKTRIQEYQLADAKDKIKLQVNQESYKLTEADRKLTAAKKNTEKADENLKYANAGFEEGVISASDAMAAHTAWISAHSELIDAQIDLKLCHIYLNKALGRNLQ